MRTEKMSSTVSPVFTSRLVADVDQDDGVRIWAEETNPETSAKTKSGKNFLMELIHQIAVQFRLFRRIRSTQEHVVTLKISFEE